MSDRLYNALETVESEFRQYSDGVLSVRDMAMISVCLDRLWAIKETKIDTLTPDEE